MSPSEDMSPYCSAHDEWLIMKLCMHVGYHDANNVSNFSGDPVTQLHLENVFVYEIGLIDIREVSPPLDEENIEHQHRRCRDDALHIVECSHLRLSP